MPADYPLSDVMHFRGVALLSLAPAALGCAGTVSSGSDGVDAEAVTTTSALVTIERSADPMTGARAEASARFLRVLAPATPDEALRAIGAALDLPPVGSCLATAPHGTSAASVLPSVELLDVGSVSVEAAGVETRMSPRLLPDVTDVVSGVVYARGADPASLPDTLPYVVRVAGTQGLGPFAFAATAAGDPAEVHVEGEDAGSLEATGPAVNLTWPASIGDVVYVDVRPAGVRCTLGDPAVADVDHGHLSTLLLDEGGTLVIHRLHREALRAPSLEGGEIRFDFARTLSYVRR